MFRTIANASLRRFLHTSSRPAALARPARLRAVLGASAVATSYFVWSSWYGQRIALDAPSSPPKSKQVPLASKSSTSPESIAHSDSIAPQHEPSIHGDLPSPSDASAEENQTGQSAEGEVEGSSPPGGAFNPETGEINWDCPCLGGMAHGPCGMQFREAFSCFVFSEADPKGIDCVEKFKAMQECFREHPDVYGEDIMNDDDDEDLALDQPQSLDNADESPKESDPAVPASEPAETKPVPTEQESKPRKASAPTSH
ncbi:hypothetical protein C8Q74DRAFT_1199112 [Fomes fomentarius]|nr:hypothetical protein C8Q74DRAFT_1199112 [Fomes fomentarius]